MKAKILSAIMESLSSSSDSDGGDGRLGAKERVRTPLSELREGANDGILVVVGVAAVVSSGDSIPQYGQHHTGLRQVEVGRQ